MPDLNVGFATRRDAGRAFDRKAPIRCTGFCRGDLVGLNAHQKCAVPTLYWPREAEQSSVRRASLEGVSPMPPMPPMSPVPPVPPMRAAPATTGNSRFHFRERQLGLPLRAHAE